MSSQNEAFARQQLEAQHAAIRATNDAAEQQRRQSAAEADRLRALRDNAEVQWFLETHVAPIVAREQREALDIARTAAQRDISAHRCVLAEELHGLLVKLTAEKEAAAQPPPPPSNQ